MTTQMWLMVLCSLVLSAAARPLKVHLAYPVELLPPITGSYFSATVAHDKLTCFGNRDYHAPTYLQTLWCMVPYAPGARCENIWGSRSVLIEASGSIEFLKLSGGLPHESTQGEVFPLNATRWLDLSAHDSRQGYKEMLQIQAEPLYLCARSNDWRGGGAHFSISFRDAHVRLRDQAESHSKTLLHLLVIAALSSAWLLPYVLALLVALVTFLHGLKVVLAIVGTSAFVVCLAPLMLTRHNRYLARLYFNYFFTRIEAEDTQTVLRRRAPVFQALFFSSCLVCAGSAFAYLLYRVGGVDREMRNVLLRCVLSVAVSWFAWFVGRSLERFFRDWLWLATSVALARLLDAHLNPLSRDKVVVAAMVLSQALLLGLRHLKKTHLMRGVERMALPSLVLVATLLGVRLSEDAKKHHPRHRLPAAASPLRLADTHHEHTTAADGVSPRPKSASGSLSQTPPTRSPLTEAEAARDSSVDELESLSEDEPPAGEVEDEEEEDAVAGGLSERSSRLWERLGGLADESEGADDERRNRSALAAECGMELDVSLRSSRDQVTSADCDARNLVGAVHLPVSVLGPMRFTAECAGVEESRRMMIPLVAAPRSAAAAMQRLCAALSGRGGRVHCTVSSPRRRQLEIAAAVRFASAADARRCCEWVADSGRSATIVEAMVAGGGVMLLTRKCEVRSEVRGGEGEVWIELAVPVMDNAGECDVTVSALLRETRRAVARLLADVCRQCGGEVDRTSLTRAVASRATLEDCGSMAVTEIHLSESLLGALGIVDMQLLLEVCERSDSAACSWHVASVLCGGLAVAGLSANIGAGLQARRSGDSVVFRVETPLVDETEGGGGPAAPLVRRLLGGPDATDASIQQAQVVAEALACLSFCVGEAQDLEGCGLDR